MFSSQSLNNQIDNLQNLLEESNQNEQYLKMLEAWKKGDADKLNKVSRIEMKKAGKAASRVLAKPGNITGDLGYIIQNYVERKGFILILFLPRRFG